MTRRRWWKSSAAKASVNHGATIRKRTIENCGLESAPNITGEPNTCYWYRLISPFLWQSLKKVDRLRQIHLRYVEWYHKNQMWLVEVPSSRPPPAMLYAHRSMQNAVSCELPLNILLPFYLLLRRLKNSSLVLAVDLILPSMQLVVVLDPVFCTPRMTMHKWLDSMTTATPWGLRTSDNASATCLVRRSWTCSLRENISAIRASLERPRTRPLGM